MRQIPHSTLGSVITLLSKGTSDTVKRESSRALLLRYRINVGDLERVPDEYTVIIRGKHNDLSVHSYE